MSPKAQDSKHQPERLLAPGPLFVVSMWRSGSSLLYALLNKHPKVALTYEGDHLLLKTVFLKPQSHCDWAERWEFWNKALSRHGLSAADMPEGISDFTSAFASAHQLYARRRGATIWGDKSPNYFDRLNEMADDFPEARFIIVWRNPKSTVNSILSAGLLGNSFFSRKGAAHCGLVGYEVLKKECDTLLARGKPVCQVNYEDLVSDTPSVMRKVCAFLDIQYDDSLSHLEGADRSAIFDGRHHANLRENKIVQGPRPEPVDSALSAKIDRYVAWWRQLYDSAWPPYPHFANGARLPHPLARLADRVLYKLWRVRDRISPIVFSFFPIPLLRRYRVSKKRRHEAGKGTAWPVDCGSFPCAAATDNRSARRSGRA